VHSGHNIGVNQRGMEFLEENPYRAPTEVRATRSPLWSRLGRIGFYLSLTGVIGLTLGSVNLEWLGFVRAGLTMLCLPGLLISALGMLDPNRRLAKWGVVLGVFGSLYIPTILLGLLHGLRGASM